MMNAQTGGLQHLEKRVSFAASGYSTTIKILIEPFVCRSDRGENNSRLARCEDEVSTLIAG